MEIEVEEFVSVKGFKAKGKRISTWNVAKIKELEPTRFPEPVRDDDKEDSDLEDQTENFDPDAGKSQQEIIDKITGQLNLFSDNVFDNDDKE